VADPSAHSIGIAKVPTIEGTFVFAYQNYIEKLEFMDKHGIDISVVRCVILQLVGVPRILTLPDKLCEPLA